MNMIMKKKKKNPLKEVYRAKSLFDADSVHHSAFPVHLSWIMSRRRHVAERCNTRCCSLLRHSPESSVQRHRLRGKYRRAYDPRCSHAETNSENVRSAHDCTTAAVYAASILERIQLVNIA